MLVITTQRIMKNILVALLTLISALTFAQDGLDIFEKPISNGVELWGANDGAVPISMEISFKTLKNLECDVPLPHLAMIPSGGEPIKLLTLTVIDRMQSPEYDFRFNYIPGNVNANHDDSFEYWLPYEAGTTFKVHQGYHGNYSHKDVYALDFNMPNGTNVHAARGGMVTDIKEDSNVGCADPRCKGKSNYVVINHDDGTFSNYVHLQKNGVLVQVGDYVEIGQLIGKSGNTGWSSGPHLHFEVYSRGIKKNRSIPTVFKVKGGKAVRLQEDQSYQAVH